MEDRGCTRETDQGAAEQQAVVTVEKGAVEPQALIDSLKAANYGGEIAK